MISAIILAHNEEKNIQKVIKSVEFCNEVIVIDHMSTDKTAEIARQNKAKVYSVDKDNFAALRNFGMKKAKGEWILYIDADEVVTQQLMDEILRVIADKKNSQYSAYKIPRLDFFWGQKILHGEVLKAYRNGLTRLMKKNSGKWNGKVHETFISQFKTGKLSHYIEHYPHQSIKEFLEDINFYSTMRAQELFKMGKSTGVIKITMYPFIKFIYTFFLLGGFLDGPAGFVYSFMMSFHSFLVQSKLYLLRDNKNFEIDN